MAEASLFTVKSLHHRYGSREVLDIPALHIPAGKLTVILGPNGAGKSTLLRLLALLEAPTEGEVQVRVNGHEADHRSASTETRRAMACVFQRPALLSQSVRANIAYGLRLRGLRGREAQVDAALDRFRLTALADANARTLSGGEAQRVALARAAVLDPAILFLDEPTANLDPANVRLLEDLIRQHDESRPVTTVLVTHNLFQARRLAAYVVFLLEGRLVESGPAETFFDAPADPRTAAFLAGEMVY